MAICRAFFDEDEIRGLTQEFVAKCTQKIRESSLLRSNISFAPDALNNYVVSAYHASRACELAFEYACRDSEDPIRFAALLNVQHSLPFEAVQNLYLFRCMLLDREVGCSVGLHESNVFEAFETYFPRLKCARDALIHQDERLLGKRMGKTVATVGQMYSQSGAVVEHLLDKDFDWFTFDFSSSKIVGILTHLNRLL